MERRKTGKGGCHNNRRKKGMLWGERRVGEERKKRGISSEAAEGREEKMRWKDGGEDREEDVKGQQVWPLLYLCNRSGLFPSAPWPIHQTHIRIIGRLHRVNKS